jgi:uncharacterized membrane protein
VIERPRGRSGLVLTALAAAGLVIALYLTIVKLAGVAPVCGPSGGCEIVETSAYAEILGVPVAAIGVAYSIMATAGAVTWWRRSEVRALWVLYGLGLTGSLVEAYLVYLELAVIHAVCLWCAAYGVTVVGGLVGALLTIREHPGQAPPG